MAAARTCYGIRTFTSSAKDGLFGGAVHIRIVPRPRNLGESREILRILEKFGEIAMFKHFKYEPLAPAPNTILAIYKNPSSAQTLMKASPLLLKLELKDTGWKYLSSETPGLASESATPDLPTASREEANNLAEPSSIEPQLFRSSGYRENTQKNIAAKDSNFQSLGGSQKWGARGPSISTKSPAPEVIGSEMPIPALGSIPSPERHPTLDAAAPSPHHSRPTISQYREFELKVALSNMNHQAYIERQGYYGPFIVNRKTVMAQDLDRRVPLEGLLDCQVGKPEVPLRIRIKRTEQGTLVPFSLRAFYEEKNGPITMT